jgi:hypothetical protein
VRHLDGDLALERLVAAEVDDAEPAVADLGHDREAVERQRVEVVGDEHPFAALPALVLVARQGPGEFLADPTLRGLPQAGGGGLGGRSGRVVRRRHGGAFRRNRGARILVTGAT